MWSVVKSVTGWPFEPSTGCIQMLSVPLSITRYATFLPSGVNNTGNVMVGCEGNIRIDDTVLAATSSRASAWMSACVAGSICRHDRRQQATVRRKIAGAADESVLQYTGLDQLRCSAFDRYTDKSRSSWCCPRSRPTFHPANIRVTRRQFLESNCLGCEPSASTRQMFVVLWPSREYQLSKIGPPFAQAAAPKIMALGSVTSVD